MMYSAMTIGNEIESGILKLLQFHFVSPSNWLINNLIYFLLISMIPFAVNLAFNAILFPDGFGSLISIFFYWVECLEGSMTGVLIG